jgi:hypothetical protein
MPTVSRLTCFFLLIIWSDPEQWGTSCAVGWLALQYVTVKLPCSILGFDSDIVAVRL